MRPAARSVATPTASMADIAFLLLVFFLLATAIQREDLGLPVLLPPASTTAPAHVPALLSVLVSADGAVLVDGMPVERAALRAEVAAFATGVQESHVALQTAARTPYADYVAAFDAIRLGQPNAGATPRLTLRTPAGRP